MIDGTEIDGRTISAMHTRYNSTVTNNIVKPDHFVVHSQHFGTIAVRHLIRSEAVGIAFLLLVQSALYPGQLSLGKE